MKDLDAIRFELFLLFEYDPPWCPVCGCEYSKFQFNKGGQSWVSGCDCDESSMDEETRRIRNRTYTLFRYI